MPVWQAGERDGDAFLLPSTHYAAGGVREREGVVAGYDCCRHGVHETAQEGVRQEGLDVSLWFCAWMQRVRGGVDSCVIVV